MQGAGQINITAALAATVRVTPAAVTLCALVRCAEPATMLQCPFLKIHSNFSRDFRFLTRTLSKASTAVGDASMMHGRQVG